MKKVKIRYDRIIILVLIICLIVFLILGIKHIMYTHTYEYKLLNKGYDKDTIKYFETLENDKKDYILSIDYNENLINILKEKYFMWKNIDKYISYYNENKDKTMEDVIAIVNVKANYDWYDSNIVKETDTSLNEALLVNKFNYLPNNYSDNLDIVDIKNWYAFGERKIIKTVYEKYIEMYNDAKKEGLNLVISSAYRTNSEQERLYNERKDTKGLEYADNYAARPLYSEHETGLALDIFTPEYPTIESFENSNEYKWLIENSYKYGFVLRYPKDKEYLTGYKYESWHFRYLGVDLATKVYESELTYDEYYAYYIEK